MKAAAWWAMLPHRLLWLCIALGAGLGVGQGAWAQANWARFALISPTTTLETGRLCYTDGKGIACDTGAPLASGLGLGDRIISGTTNVVANNGGPVSVTIAGSPVANFGAGGLGITAINASGLLQSAGVSSSAGISGTTGYFSGSVGIARTSSGAIDSKITLSNLASASGTGSSVDYYHDNGSGAYRTGRIGFRRSPTLGANFGELFLDLGVNNTWVTMISADANNNVYVPVLNASAGLFGTITNASNAGLDNILTLTKMTSGAAAAGLGSGILFRGQGSNSAPYNMGQIATVYTSAVAAAQTANMIFSTASTGTMAERVRITGGGLVGIGTQSPTVTLQVSGTISATAVVAGTMQLTTSNTACGGAPDIGKHRYNGNGIEVCTFWLP